MSRLEDLKLTQETKFNEKYLLTHPVSGPEYKYSKLVPIGGHSASLSASNLADVTFRITTVPFNPAKSFFSFHFVTDNGVAADAEPLRMSLDSFPFIDSISAITQSGVPIINKLQYIPQYLKVMNPRQTNIKQYLQSDPDTLFYPSNELADDNKTVSSAGALIDGFTNYHENKHLLQSGANANDILQKDISLAFSSVKNTFLSIDKTVQLPEILELTFSMGNCNNFIWRSPAAGPALYAGTVTVTNMSLYLAVENNPTNVLTSQSLLNTGYSIHLPVVEASRRTDTTSAESSYVQTLDISIGKHGNRLRKIYISPFTHGATTAATFLNNSIVPGDPITETIRRFYTQYNNERRQNFDITPTNYMDYKLYRKAHPEGDDAILSRDYYYYNYCILDEFDSGLPISNNISAGLELKNQQATYDCNMTFREARAYDFYRFIISERTLFISSAGIKFA